eukprot:3245093-Amphidinium_carterae.1
MEPKAFTSGSASFSKWFSGWHVGELSPLHNWSHVGLIFPYCFALASFRLRVVRAELQFFSSPGLAGFRSHGVVPAKTPG